MKKYIVYHFSRNDNCLEYGDNRKIVLGETLSVEGKPSLCSYGLHGSISVVDALGYASGSHLWLTEIWGNVDIGDNVLCGQHRKAIVEYGNVLSLIVEFAEWCANQASIVSESSARAAEYSAISAEYARYTKCVTNLVTEVAAYATEAARYSRYAKYTANHPPAREIKYQEHWWGDKLSQLKR